METLTITRIGEEKEKSGTSQKTGKPYHFFQVAFQCSEKEGWVSLSYNEKGKSGLEIGNTYELELTSREYQGKTYWSAKFPSKVAKMEDVVNKIAQDVQLMLTRQSALANEILILKDHVVPKNTKKSYPEDDYPEPTF